MGMSKSVHLKNVTSVAPYDAAKPQMLKFKAGHKEYESAWKSTSVSGRP